MANIPTSISIDEELKAKAQELFSDLGLDLSTAINIFCGSLFATTASHSVSRERSPMRIQLQL